MSRPLIFVGSRQMMRSLATIAELRNIEVLGILDHHYWGNTESIGDVPVIGDERWLLDINNSQAQKWLAQCDFFVANWWKGSQHLNESGPDLGLLRLQRIAVVEKAQAQVINLIHPNAKVPVNLTTTSKYSNYRLGRGILIDDDCWHGIDNIEIGDYSACTNSGKIAHDVKIGKNVIVGPASYLYNCTIGDNSYIGRYSRLNNIQGDQRALSIGKNCTVWSSTEVVKDIPDNSIYTHHGKVLKKIVVNPTFEEMVC